MLVKEEPVKVEESNSAELKIKKEEMQASEHKSITKKCWTLFLTQIV
jgi:hypothetical protein